MKLVYDGEGYNAVRDPNGTYTKIPKVKHYPTAHIVETETQTITFTKKLPPSLGRDAISASLGGAIATLINYFL